MKYPIYYKTSAHQIKAISSDSSVWITKTKIEEYPYHELQYLKELSAKPSTEKQFLKAYNKTTEYLYNLVKN